ncbi:glycoside hydrolase family 1 protein [Candidatus Bathyarchaeota archaeon]|nr:MAG: glycoside hydrolase family 1 protein [Candidatus Bathyarchaeota archaeon]
MMVIMNMKFPKDFLWGTATSAFQIEMGRGEPDPNSDWYVWVHDEDNIKNGLVSGDLPENGPGFWELYPEDLRRAKDELGNNAFRMSIDWSRIFPNPTWEVPVKVSFNSTGDVCHVEISDESMHLLEEKAYQPSVKKYRDILTECKKLGLTVLLTLYHWPLPLWIHDPIACRDDIVHADRRGWVDQSTIIEFAKYAAYIAKTFGDLVDIYATMNEPMVVSGLGYFYEKSGFPPGLSNLDLFVKVTKNLAIAHGIAYEQVKEWDRVSCSNYGPAYVGIVHCPQYYEPYNKDSKEDVKAANFLEYIKNEWFLNMIIKGDFDLNLNMTIEPNEKHPSLVKGCDFIGINYYTRQRVKAAESKIPGIPGFEVVPCTENCTDMGWEIYPKGLRYVLNWAYQLYRRPLMVTENGIADAKDEKRADFLINHIQELHKAIVEDGIPVKGYFYWSLIDNFEWAKGFKMRFGLYRVDYKTKKRTPTKAVSVYKQIASGAFD